MTALNDKVVTARKAHICDSCSQTIEPGQRYRRRVETIYDELTSTAWCSPCEQLGSDLFNAGIEGEDEWGCLAYPVLTDVELEDVQDLALRERLHQWQWRFKSYLNQLKKAAR